MTRQEQQRLWNKRYRVTENGKAKTREAGRRTDQKRLEIDQLHLGDWIAFFSSLNNSSERRAAAHAMIALAEFDYQTRRIVRHPKFDDAVLSLALEV